LEKVIEECAQKILGVLAKTREMNILRLSEHIAERSMVVYQAVGWLARDGRIAYEEREKQVYVRLRSDSGGAPPTQL
jgi:hypothetical protein